MIKKFKDTPCLKNSGIVYQDTFKSAKELYELDPVRGGELAMAILEIAMTGDYRSDDAMFKIILNPFITQTNKTDQTYKKKKEEGKAKQVAELSLDKIAEYYNQGMTQNQISNRLHGAISQQTVSARLRKIKELYPEMINEEEHKKNTSKAKVLQDENSCIQDENACKKANFNF